MKTAIIAGASGLVGSSLLTMLLDSNHYDKVISLGRKTLPLQHKKLLQMQVDFTDLSSFHELCDHVYCCLGTTIRVAGTKERFFQIDHDFPLELAKATLHNGAHSFTIITAIASDEKSPWFYSRVKGKLEKALMELGFTTLIILRPSMLLGPRKEFRLAEWISKQIMTLCSWMIPAKYKAVKDFTVARCMLESNFCQLQGTHIIENSDILKFNN
jgi:uncharacterized protein YbjT (DUF2867 family)